jgi:hypothetical protein
MKTLHNDMIPTFDTEKLSALKRTTKKKKNNDK